MNQNTCVSQLHIILLLIDLESYLCDTVHCSVSFLMQWFVDSKIFSVLRTSEQNRTLYNKGWFWKFPNFVFANISIKSSPNLKSKVSFEICLFWGFQNWPYFWILANWKLRKWRQKTPGVISIFHITMKGIIKFH